MKTLRYPLVPALLLAASPALAGDIPMIGLDDSGEPVTYLESESTYVGKMSAIASSVGESIAPGLESTPARWMLRTVAIGIGGGVQVGIGPIIQVKASPRFRLLYSNSKDPVVP